MLPLSGRELVFCSMSVSSDILPRGTCYGLSAALGKTGAAVGTQAFTPIQNNLGKKSVI